MRKIRRIALILVLSAALWPMQASAQSGGEVINIEQQNLIATVSIEAAELRAGPGPEHALVGTVSQGTHLPVVAQSNGWYQVVQPTAQQAWVPSWVVRHAWF